MIMETKVNVRGAMNTLKINEVMELPKEDYKPASIRSTAASICENEGKVFLVC